MGDDKNRSRSYDEPPSGVVFTSRGASRVLSFRLAEEPKVGFLAGKGFIERVLLEPSPRGFRARLPKDHDRLPRIGASLLLDVAASLEGAGAATLHLPVTLRQVRHSGLVAFLDLELDGFAEQRLDLEPQRFEAQVSLSSRRAR